MEEIIIVLQAILIWFVAYVAYIMIDAYRKTQDSCRGRVVIAFAVVALSLAASLLLSV